MAGKAKSDVAQPAAPPPATPPGWSVDSAAKAEGHMMSATVTYSVPDGGGAKAAVVQGAADCTAACVRAVEGMLHRAGGEQARQAWLRARDRRVELAAEAEALAAKELDLGNGELAPHATRTREIKDMLAVLDERLPLLAAAFAEVKESWKRAAGPVWSATRAAARAEAVRRRDEALGQTGPMTHDRLVELVVATRLAEDLRPGTLDHSDAAGVVDRLLPTLPPSGPEPNRRLDSDPAVPSFARRPAPIPQGVPVQAVPAATGGTSGAGARVLVLPKGG
jgi:hypothetical protein